MIRKSLIALATVALAAVAAPAFASPDPIFGTSDIDQLTFAKTATINELKDRGYNATDVEAYGQYIKADVRLSNGQNAVQFFDPATLTPVGGAHVN